jgi:hypothetical protein
MFDGKTRDVGDAARVARLALQLGAEKAVKRYAAALKKKWRRWNEAMFEVKSSSQNI